MSRPAPSQVVWITPNKRRAFVVPGSTVLPVGDLELVGVHGETRFADEDALISYEVPPAAAEQVLEEEARELTAALREQVGELLTVLRFAGSLRWNESEAKAAWGDSPIAAAAEDLLDHLKGRFEAGTPPEREPKTETKDEAPRRPEDLLGEAARDMGQRLRAVLATPEVSSAIATLGSRLQDLASGLAEGPSRPRPSEPDDSKEGR